MAIFKKNVNIILVCVQNIKPPRPYFGHNMGILGCKPCSPLS